ncbi:hypothetical protein [Methylocystis parvus]|uniref:Uncharacterized protein n=1 Tax=Methylocystis parvus TaxID=134 RepID=A0A6B8MFG1_9HYPH|nr:hypothetical protein [Methylocystis parvus]QGM99410.1 hypothetical protein F7D14_19255 [Methylocystis parvus]WBK00198.1 hypothetical protein MMG94_00280 [Methylocystis parvus OBBP]
MSLDYFQNGVGSAPRTLGVRIPANVNLSARPRVVAASRADASHFETMSLGILLTAVAAVLPLLMMLHQ